MAIPVNVPRRGRSPMRRPRLARRPRSAVPSRSRSVSLVPSRGYVSVSKRRRVNRLIRMRKRNFKTIAGAGGQVSNFKLGRPMPSYAKTLLKGTTFKVHRSLLSRRINCSQGQQAVANYGILYGGGYANTGSPVFEIPYLLNIASGSGLDPISIANGNVGSTTKIFLHKVFAKYMLTNMDIGNLQLHIFDVIAKRDYVEDAQQAFQGGIVDVSGGTASDAALGLMPWSSTEFNTHFRVLQKSSIILAQGQSHTHFVNYKPNKSVSAQILNSGDYTYKGYTIYTMIIIHGLPVNDRDNKTQVTTGSVSLDVVQTKEIHWSWMEHNKSKWTTTGGLPLVANEYELNIGSGQPALDTEA